MRYVFVLIFFALHIIDAQQESLLQVAKKTKDPVEKAAIYLKLVAAAAYSDSVKAKQYLKEAERLTPANHKIGQAEIQNSWGYYYMPVNTEKAKEHHLKGIAILENENSGEAQNLRSKLWFNVAADCQRMGNTQQAMEVLLKTSIPEAQKAPDKIYLANNYLTVGLIFYNDNNLDKAIQYHEMAVKTVKQLKPSDKTENLYLTAQLYIAESYLKKENYPKVRAILDGVDAQFKQKLTDEQLPEFFHLESIYHLKTGNFKAALDHANTGLKVAERTGNLYQFVRLTFMKSKAQSNLGHLTEAAKTLNDLLNNEAYVKNYSTNLSTIYDELWMLEERRGNFKEALSFAKKRIEVSDSLYASGQNEMINEMETKFRTAEKEKQIAQKELEISNKNTYLWILGLLSLLFLSSAFFIYKNFKNKKRLAEQREIQLQQQLREKEREEELKVTKAILEGAERERERVAKDLHDGLGGMLAGVKINLSTWSNHHLEENQYESFHKILNQLDSSVSELRRVARNLMPESLLNFGLEIALKDLCEFYMKDDLNVDFQAINIKKDLPLNLQINIYRIVQELLANAVKHSGASSILVQCSQDGNRFLITVEDNGKGLNEDAGKISKSLGLKNLKNRVDYLKGKMEIHSERNEGTAVNIEFITHDVA